MTEKQLLTAREEFRSFMAVETKDLKKAALKTKAAFFIQKLNTSFEELACIGYNPAFSELTATVRIKRASGYSGQLCTQGSQEYVRFYLDYEDGAGWQDMGVTAVNVHDIPTQKDCSGNNELPMDYVVRLQINPKRFFCTKANTPKVKAILAWNEIPAPNDPNMTAGTYTWSDMKEEYIQIEPLKIFIPDLPLLNIGSLLEKAIANPNTSLNSLAQFTPNGLETIKEAQQGLKQQVLDFPNLSNLYKKKKIEPFRFGLPLLKKVQQTNDPQIVSNIQNIFEAQNLSLAESLAGLLQTECNTNYEELFCVGLDYTNEALVGTLKIKRPSGYSGDLCKDGSKEYVSFWIQDEDENCAWKHAGTTFVKVHDIDEIPDGGLSYSVILPYDFSALKKNCETPKVLKVRAVLSWNQPPNGMGCETWGNVIETYIQLKPSIAWDGEGPKMITVGGVATDFIDNVSGLTLPGAKMEFNQQPTYDDSPFGGIIVVQGVSTPFAGQKYKVKVTNLATGASYYLNNKLDLLGYNPVTGVVTHPDLYPVGDEYEYQPYHNNISSVLARFVPGTNDRLRITIEHSDGTQDSQVIQMDNTPTTLNLNIDDGGDCSHYTKGDTVIGNFSVTEDYLEAYSLSSSAGTYSATGTGLGQFGNTEGSGTFEIATDPNKNCGNVVLSATQKAIRHSAYVGRTVTTSRIICLSD
ncbi:hypothetical protein C8D94_101140 [Marinirhabdus gelatinilytica]|uniref:Uncharacterized protein n=2 Tax=Marinirhabdus gelatinilytica TaxID=1703343 RepID=A0A370QIV5_9FLAO|nr:hypothetical protein C8D94_101140 [Marinirhabdus gelatinilytica]